MELLNVPTIGAVDSKVLLLDGVTAKSAPITVAGRELIACDSNVSQRESLGLGALATLSAINLSTSFATGVLPIAKGGTGSNSGIPYGSVKDLTTQSILGRKATTTGNAELLSGSDVLNMIGTTQGSILYRGASGWFELQPGSANQVLITNGQNANPAWSNVVASVPVGDKGDITVSNSGNTWIIDNDVVTYAKIQNVSATNKVLGRSSLGPGDVQEIDCTAAGRAIIGAADAASQRTILELLSIATTGSASDLETGTIPDARFPALTGDVTSTAGTVSTTIAANAVTTTKIANDNVTYAKIQNVTASKILGRKTNTNGDVEECSLSEVLDLVGSPSQGDILYRNATGWTRLGAGTANYFLKTNGPNQNPSWAEVSSGGTGSKDFQVMFNGGVQAISSAENGDGWGWPPHNSFDDKAASKQKAARFVVPFNPTAYRLSAVCTQPPQYWQGTTPTVGAAGLRLQYALSNSSSDLDWTDFAAIDFYGKTTGDIAGSDGAIAIPGNPSVVYVRILILNTLENPTTGFFQDFIGFVINLWK